MAIAYLLSSLCGKEINSNFETVLGSELASHFGNKKVQLCMLIVID